MVNNFLGGRRIKWSATPYQEKIVRLKIFILG